MTQLLSCFSGYCLPSPLFLFLPRPHMKMFSTSLPLLSFVFIPKYQPCSCNCISIQSLSIELQASTLECHVTSPARSPIPLIHTNLSRFSKPVPYPSRSKSNTAPRHPCMEAGSPSTLLLTLPCLVSLKSTFYPFPLPTWAQGPPQVFLPGFYLYSLFPPQNGQTILLFMSLFYLKFLRLIS